MGAGPTGRCARCGAWFHHTPFKRHIVELQITAGIQKGRQMLGEKVVPPNTEDIAMASLKIEPQSISDLEKRSEQRWAESEEMAERARKFAEQAAGTESGNPDQ